MTKQEFKERWESGDDGRGRGKRLTHMTTPPDFIVTCSCRRAATIYWSPSNHRYFTLTPGWRPSYPAGWTCGHAGHQQCVPPQPIGRPPLLAPEQLKIVL